MLVIWWKENSNRVMLVRFTFLPYGHMYMFFTNFA